MKRIISAVAIAGLFSLAACNNAEKEMAIREQQRQIDAINMEMAKKKVIDSMNEMGRYQYALTPQNMMAQPATQYVMASAPQQVRYVPVSTTRTRSYAPRRTYVRSTRRSYSGYSQPVVYQQPRRRGWSAKAKGAVIGGAGGAIAGAIINKRNRPVGALLGGLLGAGAGTGIGAIIDHRNGR